LASVIYNKNRFKHTHDNTTLNQDDKFAFGLLERSVKEGYLNSKKLLGDFYYFGYGVAIDYKKSLQNHIDYANTQDGQENFRAGVEYYDNKKYNSQGWNIALVYITKASNLKKNINAQKFLFDTFYSGQNTAPFIKEIGELHKALADQKSDNENMDAGIRYFYRWRNPLTGLVYLHRAANQENPVALRILGDLYCYGNNVDKNYDKAKELHKLSSIQLSSRECFRIGESYYKGTRLFTKNHEIAFIYSNESITKDNYNTWRYLDDTYSFGDVVEIDEVKALRLHEIFAATLGEDNLIYVGQSYYSKEYYSIAAIYLTKIKRKDPAILRSLGDMYYYGKDIEKNYEKALWCHKVSANLLIQKLNCRIGLEYFNTTYKSKPNVKTGLIYINKAINQSSSTAARFIADKYYYGDDGIDKDHVKALEFYKTSAGCQDEYDNFRTGKDYYEGNGNYKKNTTVGLIYLNKAAFDRSYPEALQYLGDLFFYSDDGTDKDQAKAPEFHTMLADCLDGSDNFGKGRGYYEGKGDIKKNPIIGYIYISKALDEGCGHSSWYFKDIYYFGEAYEKYSKIGLDLRMTLENNI
jgi:TPR repeat protein